MRVQDLGANDGGHVIGRPYVLVVLQQGEGVIGELGLGSVGGGHVHLVVGEHLVFEALVEDGVVLPVKGAVDGFQRGQAVGTLVELALAGKAQLAGVLLQVRDGLDAKALRRLGTNDQALAVGGFGLVEPDQVELLFVLVLHGVVGGVGVGDRVHLEDGDQAGAGVFRVQVDVAALQGGVDKRAGDLEGAVHLEAGVLQRQGVELGEDHALGEGLGAHGDGVGSFLGAAHERSGA